MNGPVVHGAMGYSQKTYKLLWRYHLPLSGFLANDHLPRMSRHSANDKGNNEMIPGSVHRSTGIDLITEENPGKPQLGRFATSDRLNWGIFLPNYVDRIA